MDETLTQSLPNTVENFNATHVKAESENINQRFKKVSPTYLLTFVGPNGVIQPAVSMLISPALIVSDFKRWISDAWGVPVSEVKKPSLSTGGRVWMGVVHRLNKMIIIRKYKLESEEYWMVTYVGDVVANPEETKRRRIDCVAPFTEVLSTNAKRMREYGPETDNGLVPQDSRLNAAAGGGSTTLESGEPSHPPADVDADVHANKKKSSLESVEEEAISALLNMSAELPTGPVDSSYIASQVASLMQPPAPSKATHSTILESLDNVMPEVGMLLSANLKVSDFKKWFADSCGVTVSEVRKAPASTGGRVWMATISRLNKMIILRKYRIDPQEYWMVTYYSCVSINPVEARRSKIEHFRQMSAMGGATSAESGTATGGGAAEESEVRIITDPMKCLELVNDDRATRFDDSVVNIV